MSIPDQVAAYLDADRLAHELADAQPVTRTAEPLLTAEQIAAADDMARLT